MSDDKQKQDEFDHAFFREDGSRQAGGPLVSREEEEELERVLKGTGGRARHPVLAGLVVLASLAVLYLMWDEVFYFFQGSSPKDLGDAAKALAAGKLRENTYVRLKGFPDLNTKARVTHQGCNLAPKSAPDKFYTFTVLANTNDSIVVRRSLTKKQRLEEAKRPKVVLRVSGRLVRFRRKRKAAFEKYRNFLRRMSDQLPMLRREYRISRGELARAVGKSPVQLKDVKGRIVGVGPGTRVALYVAFLDELEYRLDRTFQVAAEHVTFVGGRGPACPSIHRGRDFILQRQEGVFDFGGLKKGATVRADEESEGGAQPQRGPMPPRVLYVPPDTKVYDAKTGDPLEFDGSGRLVVAQGGACGKPGTSRQVNLEVRPFRKKKEAVRFVGTYGLPFALAEEEPDSFLFILRGPAAKLKEIVQAQRQSSPYSASTRTEWFEAKWHDLRLAEDQVVIRPARPSYPPRYELVREKQGPGKLVKRSWGEEVRLPLAWVRYGTVSKRRDLPQDAWLLMAGVAPKQFWYYPLLALLLFGFMLFNALAIFRHLRSRRR